MHGGWALASGLLSTSLYFLITTGPIKVETTHGDTGSFISTGSIRSDPSGPSLLILLNVKAIFG